MTTDQTLTPQALTERWQQRWPGCPPLAHEFKVRYPDRWIRFHSLPESKRYPDNEAEYAVVLHRHHTVLAELEPGPDLLVVTTDWTDTEATTPQPWPRRSEVAPQAWHWQTILEYPDEAPEQRSYTQLYAETIRWWPGTLDTLLRAVADDELANVILAPLDLRWLYHPYDGGADVVLASREQRDGLEARHREWLSIHPSGL